MAPFEYVDASGAHAGITADYVKILNKRLGITLTPVAGTDRSQIMEMVRGDKVDVIAAIIAHLNSS